MDDFSRAVEAWRREPFPPGSATDVLGELHADLALADSWVAEAVIPFVDRGVFEPPNLDVLGEVRLLLDRAIALGGSADAHVSKCADRYRNYAVLLISVYEAFLAKGRGPR